MGAGVEEPVEAGVDTEGGTTRFLLFDLPFLDILAGDWLMKS